MSVLHSCAQINTTLIINTHSPIPSEFTYLYNTYCLTILIHVFLYKRNILMFHFMYFHYHQTKNSPRNHNFEF